MLDVLTWMALEFVSSAAKKEAFTHCGKHVLLSQFKDNPGGISDTLHMIGWIA